MEASVRLPENWKQAIRQGQGVVAEISVAAAEIHSQQLAAAVHQNRSRAGFFFLQTQDGREDQKRFSLIAGEPLFSFLARGRRGIWQGQGGSWDLNEPPERVFEALGEALRQCGMLEVSVGMSPMLGWLTYEAGARYERLPLPQPDPLGMPDWHLMLPGEWAWLDVGRQEWRFRTLLADRPFYARIQSVLGLPAQPVEFLPPLAAEECLEAWRLRVSAWLKLAAQTPSASMPPSSRQLEITDNFTEKGFCDVVQSAKEYIASGDVFQVNISHRQSAPYGGKAWPLFCRLSQINPSPYACFADLGSYQIVSASPERLFLQDGSHVETHPIAGTLAKTEEGSAEAEKLLLSDKDRAEHIMTVDIERNDLARVCVAGSVRAKDLMARESYSHVHHLVSRLEGKLKEGCDFPDLLRAGFPGGSITGAPKIRCMEIIAELEQERRGLYTGSLGYWDPIHRKADFNIMIRSIFLGHGKAVWQVGAGIVADSNPQKEWEETLHKAAALKQALETAPL